MIPPCRALTSKQKHTTVVNIDKMKCTQKFSLNSKCNKEKQTKKARLKTIFEEQSLRELVHDAPVAVVEPTK